MVRECPIFVTLDLLEEVVIKYLKTQNRAVLWLFLGML